MEIMGKHVRGAIMIKPLLSAALILAAGCSKPSETADPKSALIPGKLQEAVESARHKPPCDRVIALEWSNTWPVPFDDPQGKKFHIFFYPVTGIPHQTKHLFSPIAEAVVDLKSGNPIACRMLPQQPKELSQRVYSDKARALGIDGLAAQAHALYVRTEDMAALYAARGKQPLTMAERTTAAEYMDIFEIIAEPDLLSYYYRINPSFWEWLFSATGRSIPQVAPQRR